MEHTKGEWKVEVTDTPETFTVTARRPNVRDFICKAYGIENAKLIAAAPDLLEALRFLLQTANPRDVTPHKGAQGLDLGEFYVGSCGIPSDESIHKAFAAIKKATE